MHADAAIQMALQGRWNEALQINRIIVESFPNDVDAYNRLGKAFTELGRYDAARDAYSKALSIEPSNTIARKNLSRLSGLKATDRTRGTAVAARVDPRLFIEEAGKTAVAVLFSPGTKEVLARVTAGDQVSLGQRGDQVQVFTVNGDYLCQLEPRLGTRVNKLTKGGNRYEAAITTVDRDEVRVIIHEAYADPSNFGKVSFPASATARPGDVRPYMKGTPLRYDDEEEAEELEEESEEVEELDTSLPEFSAEPDLEEELLEEP